MDGYKHYIRIDTNNIVIHGFSDAFETMQQSDIQLSGDFGRHFQFQLMTNRGQFMYKLINGAMAPRTQTELDEEWAARPPEPPSLEQQIADMQDVINTLLMGGI